MQPYLKLFTHQADVRQLMETPTIRDFVSSHLPKDSLQHSGQHTCKTIVDDGLDQHVCLAHAQISPYRS